MTDQTAMRWDHIFSTRSWGRYPPEELVRFVARKFPERVRTGLRALEVGCGPGANLWFLDREGFHVHAIDASPVAIDQARGRHEFTNPVDIRLGDFASLPWPSEHFDLVIDINALCSNDGATIAKALSEIHRVLKPGGWFFCKTFGAKTEGILSGELIDQRTTRNPVRGPLAGMGMTTAFHSGELNELATSYSSVVIDWTERKDEVGVVFEWIVQARK